MVVMSTPSNLPTCLPYLNKTGDLTFKMMSILSFGRVQVFMNQACLARLMKKALAQNPNLLRTLIGLSLTLIFMLSYAVYGATVSPNYYIYQTESTTTEFNEIDLDKQVINNQTYWTAVVETDAQNLTWVNMSVEDLATGAVIKLSNTAKLYSHQFLGVEDAKVTVDGDKVDFRCSEHCQFSDTIEVESEESSIELLPLHQPILQDDPMELYTPMTYKKQKKRPGKKLIICTVHHNLLSKYSNPGINLFNQ